MSINRYRKQFIKDILNKSYNTDIIPVFYQYCGGTINNYMKAYFLKALVIDINEDAKQNEWTKCTVMFDEQVADCLNLHKDTKYDVWFCYDEPIRVGDYIFGLISLKTFNDVIYIQMPCGYTTFWIHPIQEPNSDMIDYELDESDIDDNFMRVDRKIVLSFIKQNIKVIKDYKSSVTKDDLSDYAEATLEELNDINHDLDLIREYEGSKIYKSSEGSDSKSINQGLRLRVHVEHKIYFWNSSKHIFNKTKYFPIRPGLEKSSIEKLGFSFIQKVNDGIFEIAKNEGIGKIFLFRRYNLKPEQINYERKPIGKRTSITLFNQISAENHKSKTDILFYEDGTKCSLSLSDIFNNEEINNEL